MIHSQQASYKLTKTTNSKSVKNNSAQCVLSIGYNEKYTEVNKYKTFQSTN